MASAPDKKTGIESEMVNEDHSLPSVCIGTYLETPKLTEEEETIVKTRAVAFKRYSSKLTGGKGQGKKGRIAE